MLSAFSLQLLKQRVSQLEGAAQQVDMVRQENAMLRQKVMEMDAAVSNIAASYALEQKANIDACHLCVMKGLCASIPSDSFGASKLAPLLMARSVSR